eukprot:894226-Rhodomonas_salina.5
MRGTEIAYGGRRQGMPGAYNVLEARGTTLLFHVTLPTSLLLSYPIPAPRPAYDAIHLEAMLSIDLVYGAIDT